MKQLLAIAFLTVKSALRYKLVVVIAVILIGTVLVLPAIIKHDNTANGFIQIIMTYTLGVIIALLGFVTLWLACGTLARDVEECQMQMVAVKPVERWKIWLGKWLGIMMINAGLLFLSGTIVFVLIQMKAKSLPEEQQIKLRQEVLVARASITEPEVDLEPAIERSYKEVLQEGAGSLTQADLPYLRQNIEEFVKREYQLVRPDHLRRWRLDFGNKKEVIRDQPLYVRFKFRTPMYLQVNDDPNTYQTVWLIGEPTNPDRRPRPMKLSAGSFHEFEIPPNLFNEEGVLTIDMENRSGSQLYVPLDEPLEVLYRESGFAVNFARGITILFCWLGLLAAIGLCTASFLSFPVASFCALGILVLGFSTSTISQTLEEGSFLGVDHHDTTGQSSSPMLDKLILPVMGVLLKVIHLAKDFSPIDSLSSGRSITWFELFRAVMQILFLMGGIIGLIGVFAFNRRELATAQGSH